MYCSKKIYLFRVKKASALEPFVIIFTDNLGSHTVEMQKRCAKLCEKDALFYFQLLYYPSAVLTVTRHKDIAHT